MTNGVAEEATNNPNMELDTNTLTSTLSSANGASIPATSLSSSLPGHELHLVEKYRSIVRSTRRQHDHNCIKWYHRDWIDRIGSFLNFNNWRGVGRMRLQLDLMDQLLQSLIGLLVPVLSYRFFFALLVAVVHQPLLLAPTPSSLILPYLVSPWTVSIAYQGIVRPWFQTVTQVGILQFKMRSHTLPDAYLTLGRRIKDGRALRYRKYDLYLPPPPPPPSDTTQQGQSSLPTSHRMILFLPGINVESLAYAHPAALLSDGGYHVLVANTEWHWRMASRYMGYNTPYCAELQRHAQQQVSHRWWHRQVNNNETLDCQANPVERNLSSSLSFQWYGVAHSLGSFTLSHLDCQQLGIQKLIFWGVAPFVQEMSNLTDSNHVDVLVVQGSHDAIIDLLTTGNPQLQDALYSKLPLHSTRTITIDNGTHCGFASYISQVVPEPEILPRHEQHRQAVQHTIEFLSER